MEFQEGGGALEVALLPAAALGLDLAEVVQSFLELAGEPLVVAVGVGIGFVMKASSSVVAWANGGFAGWIGDVVGREEKIDAEVA